MTEDVIYLDFDDILGFHADIFGISDEQARLRLLNPENLQSALGRPQNRAYYAGADIAEQAACLGHGIAESQSFQDGNKRTTAVAVQSFLEFNGLSLTCSDEQLAQWILELSDGLTIEDFAALLRPYIF